MWPIPQETADWVTFTEEILNGKLHFLCSDCPEIVVSVFAKCSDLNSFVPNEIFLSKAQENSRILCFNVPYWKY